MSKEITVSQCIIHFLESKGIQSIAGVPGGTILPLYESLAASKIKHILARHEQGAGFIAQGMARSSGNVGVVFVSSGPGVANLITAIADAHRDSVPILVFSGQVPLSLKGTDAFQELDTEAIVKTIVKKVYSIEDPNQIPSVLKEAYALACEGKKGPVWIDLPKDIQTKLISIPEFSNGKKEFHDFQILTNFLNPNGLQIHAQPFENFCVEFFNLIERSKFPLLYVGGGARQGYKQIREFVNRFQIPAVTTLMGLGIFDKNDPMNLGMMGMHGTIAANEALGNCDLLIAIGVRFDDRAIGNKDTFCPKAKIIHIDIAANEIGKIKQPDLSLQMDINEVFPFLLKDRIMDVKAKDGFRNVETFFQIEKWKQIPEIHPAKDLILSLASAISNQDHFILTDVGQHQMWVAQYYPFSKPSQWITSGGQGTMGFGLPTSIGVSLANPKTPVYCFTGDGSIMMNLQELATLRELNLNVKIILMNNRHLGLVKQQQDLFYGNVYSGSEFHFHPNFSMLCESFEIPYLLWKKEQNKEVLKHFFNLEGPAFLEITVPDDWGVYPFVPGGKSNQEYILDLVSK